MQLCRRNVKRDAWQDHTARNHSKTSDAQEWEPFPRKMEDGE